MLKIISQIVRNFFVYILIGTAIMSTPAYAYVDPGSGSVIVTTVLGFIAAVGYTFRKFFYNLRAKLFGGKKPDESRSLDD